MGQWFVGSAVGDGTAVARGKDGAAVMYLRPGLLGQILHWVGGSRRVKAAAIGHRDDDNDQSHEEGSDDMNSDDEDQVGVGEKGIGSESHVVEGEWNALVH